jgi:hypothetical protein
MKLRTSLFGSFLMSMLAAVALAAPVNGTYTSTDLGGQLRLGRASTWRPGVNSGLPHVLHGQDWNGSSLGGQWELRCAVETTPFTVQDLRDGNGTGVIIYTSHFTGGQLEFFAGGWPWGSGIANLGNTTIVSTVQYVTNIPVASVVNGNTSGTFIGGCALTFAIANGNGVGETPYAAKPATYPVFTDGTCVPAAPAAQFGTWGDVRTMTMNIDCATPTRPSTWGGIKTLYR